MVDFSAFDIRRYRTLPVREGYSEWVDTYEATVQDDMDLRLLNRLRSVPWDRIQQAVDLACGTGRTGMWLRQRGICIVDGVDITPEMLAVAERKSTCRALVCADVIKTGLRDEAYDLSIQVLADEHLKDLAPLYREAARITASGGHFVIVGYHPHFLMAGVVTHFHRADGEPVAIRSYVHLLSDHAKAALAAQWRLVEMDEGQIDEDWLQRKPKWREYLNQPVSFAMVWRKSE